MGPQLHRCGKRGPAHAMYSILTCFNGAATSSLRKAGDAVAMLVQTGMLQWGRNFIVAESHSLRVNGDNADSLQWGRNFIVAESTAESSMTSSGTGLQWGRNFIVAESSIIDFGYTY